MVTRPLDRATQPSAPRLDPQSPLLTALPGTQPNPLRPSENEFEFAQDWSQLSARRVKAISVCPTLVALAASKSLGGAPECAVFPAGGSFAPADIRGYSAGLGGAMRERDRPGYPRVLSWAWRCDAGA